MKITKEHYSRRESGDLFVEDRTTRKDLDSLLLEWWQNPRPDFEEINSACGFVEGIHLAEFAACATILGGVESIKESEETLHADEKARSRSVLGALSLNIDQKSHSVDKAEMSAVAELLSEEMSVVRDDWITDIESYGCAKIRSFILESGRLSVALTPVYRRALLVYVQDVARGETPRPAGEGATGQLQTGRGSYLRGLSYRKFIRKDHQGLFDAVKEYVINGAGSLEGLIEVKKTCLSLDVLAVRSASECEHLLYRYHNDNGLIYRYRAKWAVLAARLWVAFVSILAVATGILNFGGRENLFERITDSISVIGIGLFTIFGFVKIASDDADVIKNLLIGIKIMPRYKNIKSDIERHTDITVEEIMLMAKGEVCWADPDSFCYSRTSRRGTFKSIVGLSEEGLNKRGGFYNSAEFIHVVGTGDPYCRRVRDHGKFIHAEEETYNYVIASGGRIFCEMKPCDGKAQRIKRLRKKDRTGNQTEGSSEIKNSQVPAENRGGLNSSGKQLSAAVECERDIMSLEIASGKAKDALNAKGLKRD